MNYPKADSFPFDVVKSKIMGPNPLKLEEELLEKSAALLQRERAICPRLCCARPWQRHGDNICHACS